VFTGFKYKDVYLNIDELRKYITEYKGDELQNFRFECATLEPVTIKFYDHNGNLISIQSSASKRNIYSLVGVGFIQFVGDGTITEFNILGFADIK
jgi:DNA-binding transcriptional MerR regulator